MSVPHVYTPNPAELGRLDAEQLHALMLQSAAALISFYAEQIPGASADRQRSLTRTMRHVREDRSNVIAFDRTSVVHYFHRFQMQLADEQRARTAAVAALLTRPPTDGTTAFQAPPYQRADSGLWW